MSIDYSNMAFPKYVKKKKRKSHPRSIMHTKEDKQCYLCVKVDHNRNRHTSLQEHHVFQGINRGKSEHYGLKVYL